MKLMDIPYDEKGVFVSRENRFLGKVRIEGTEEEMNVHIRDPGRLEEILYRGNEVLLRGVKKESRKTDFDIVAGRVQDNWVLINSGYHRKITEKIFEDDAVNPIDNLISYKAEQMLGDSRIDFLLETSDKRIWLEVKGCTLTKDKKALFPDAPTERGRRHVEELNNVLEKGGYAALMVLVFRPDSKCFGPNRATDPDFAEAFDTALENGLDVHPLLLYYVDGSLYYRKEIPLC